MYAQGNTWSVSNNGFGQVTHGTVSDQSMRKSMKNNFEFRVDRVQTAGGVCEQRI